MKNPKSIPGIHNYCDRWCERCPLTSKCSIHQNEVQRENDGDPFDEKKLIAALTQSLNAAKQVLTKVAGNNVLQCSAQSECTSVTIARANKNAEKRPENNPLSIKSFQYAADVKEWLSRIDYVSLYNDLQNHEALGIRSEEAGLDHLKKMDDEIRIVHWHSTSIHAKLERAIVSRRTSDKWAVENGLQKDSDGSAKVALIGISESYSAWHTLLDMLPQEEDNLISFLATLQQLERETLLQFPDAMSFIRPGFDELP
jgi:hypothetical protein